MKFINPIQEFLYDSVDRTQHSLFRLEDIVVCIFIGLLWFLIEMIYNRLTYPLYKNMDSEVQKHWGMKLASTLNAILLTALGSKKKAIQITKFD